MICGWTTHYFLVYLLIKPICNKASHLKQFNKKVNKMLYYNKITNSEGIDKTNGEDSVGIKNLESRQSYCCLYYFFVTDNFKYEQHL